MSAEQEIEVTVKHLENIVSLRDALTRLKGNADFRRIIEDGYFRDNAIRLVHALAEPAISHSPEAKARTISEMDSIGCLRSFFDMIDRNAVAAETSLSSHYEELQRVREEGDE